MLIANVRLVGCFVALVVITSLITINFGWPRPFRPWMSLSHSNGQVATSKRHYAYATFLSGTEDKTAQYWNDTNQYDGLSEEEMQAKDNLDGYYQGVRHIVYSLLHHPPTQTIAEISVVVLVTKDVSARKRARLTADGAQVIVTDTIELPSWVTPGSSRWRDVMTKLALFTMTQYIKICFIDADHLVTGNLDGVFEDPATDLAQTKVNPEQTRPDEARQPATYVFAGKADAFSYDHNIPPDSGDYLNAGFYVFHPNSDMLRYYKSLLELPGRFDTQFPEQNLFNYAHRVSGNMPWQPLHWQWNMNWPTIRDVQAGVKSVHAKYWDDDPTHDQILKQMWIARLAEMHAYYRGVKDTRDQI